jgi:hypothetical protein
MIFEHHVKKTKASVTNGQQLRKESVQSALFMANKSKGVTTAINNTNTKKINNHFLCFIKQEHFSYHLRIVFIQPPIFAKNTYFSAFTNFIISKQRKFVKYFLYYSFCPPQKSKNG